MPLRLWAGGPLQESPVVSGLTDRVLAAFGAADMYADAGA
jgi:hypothetical protein